MHCVGHCMWLLVALLVALALPFSPALRITPTDVSPVASSHDHQTLERLHLVTVSDDPSETVSSIVSNAGCQVYVSYSPPESPGRLATVRVIGENVQLVQSLAAVSVTDGQPGQLHVNGGSFGRKGVDGFLRIEIQLHNHNQLQHLQSTSHGEIVVEAPELFANSPSKDLVIKLSGSGDIYLPAELPLVAQSLQIQTRGSGDLYVPTSDLTVGYMEVTISGSGAVKIGASRELHAATRITITSRGTGESALTASSYRTELLEVHLSGSADVTVGSFSSSSPEPTVTQCQYDVRGYGELNAGGVACSSAIVDISGAGDIILQARSSLVYNLSGYGDISYVGSAPLSITSSTGNIRSSAIRPTQDNKKQSKAVWMDKYSIPPRESTLMVTGVSIPSYIHDDDDDDGDDDDDSSPESTEAPDSTHADTSFTQRGVWLPVLVVMLLVVVVWNRVEAWKRKKERSGEKAPLLGSDAPVYI